jgi:tetratricopeptide (TPR) repeat protein
MVLIEEIEPEPEPAISAAEPSLSASGAGSSERQIGRSIAEAAAGMGPFEPRRARAAAALLEALRSKEEGNTCFRAGQYVEALEYYTDAIEVVDDSCDERAVFYGNRAACYASMGMQSDAIADCNAALTLRPGYAKVLMRRAKAREALDEPDAALEDMRAIVELAPGTKEARDAAACIPRLEKASNAKMEAQKEEMLGARRGSAVHCSCASVH